MTPNLRCVIWQANRSWRSVAPRRNLSSSPHESKTAESNFILRGLAMGVGYVIGEVYWRDWVQENQRVHDEYNEYFDRSEKMWADLAAAQDARKQRRVYDPKY